MTLINLLYRSIERSTSLHRLVNSCPSAWNSAHSAPDASSESASTESLPTAAPVLSASTFWGAPPASAWACISWMRLSILLSRSRIMPGLNIAACCNMAELCSANSATCSWQDTTAFGNSTSGIKFDSCASVISATSFSIMLATFSQSSPSLVTSQSISVTFAIKVFVCPDTTDAVVRLECSRPCASAKTDSRVALISDGVNNRSSHVPPQGLLKNSSNNTKLTLSDREHAICRSAFPLST
mmetsp:Transcript_97419/g.275515  ORF Transcript_97419/g.275515 Transcript_97419/m.275515 type:complete len:241 (+) Transcript_97419:381-1103(+)